MFSFIIGRIFHGLLTTILVVVLISSIIYLAPVDPARLTFGQRSDVKMVEAKKEALGLDQPLHKQLLYYLNDLSPVGIHAKELLNGNPYNDAALISIGNNKALVIKSPYLRESFQTGAYVSDMLARAIPKTVLLAFSAFFFATFFGILFGIIAALNKNSLLDNGIISFTTVGYSVPSYVSAIVLALIFGYWWRSWTGLNIQGSLVELNDLGEEVIVWKNMILPAIALGIRPLSVITQLTRSAFLDVLSEDFIRTAKAKGLGFTSIIKKHALRNSMNPVLTAVSGWMASLLAGAFFVENVFNFKGLGQLTVTALINYDIPVVLACVVFTSIVFIAINILVDIGYKLLDPKVKLN